MLITDTKRGSRWSVSLLEGFFLYTPINSTVSTHLSCWFRFLTHPRTLCEWKYHFKSNINVALKSGLFSLTNATYSGSRRSRPIILLLWKHQECWLTKAHPRRSTDLPQQASTCFCFESCHMLSCGWSLPSPSLTLHGALPATAGSASPPFYWPCTVQVMACLVVPVVGILNVWHRQLHNLLTICVPAAS